MPPKKATKEAMNATPAERDSVRNLLAAWGRLADLQAKVSRAEEENPREARRVWHSDGERRKRLLWDLREWEILGQLIVGQLKSCAPAADRGDAVSINPQAALDAIKLEWHQIKLVKVLPDVTRWFADYKKNDYAEEPEKMANLRTMVFVSWPDADFEFPISDKKMNEAFETAKGSIGLSPKVAAAAFLGRLCGRSEKSMREAVKLHLEPKIRTMRVLPPNPT